MRVIRHVTAIGAGNRPRVVAEGEFDGLHRGHAAVLDVLRVRAGEHGGETALVLHRLVPTTLRVLSLRDQLAGLAEAGIDIVVVTAAGAAAAALERLRPRVYVTGHAAAAVPPQATVEMVPRVTAADGTPITAAAIRAALAAADLDRARSMLGRDFDVSGRVVHGFHRGAPLGIPTANLRVRGVQLPPDGVYAVRAEAAGAMRLGVANLGFNPTFGNRARSLEVHLLDFTGDLYGQRLRVAFVARLRGEQRFAGVEALLAQIRADIAAARRLFAGDA